MKNLARRLPLAGALHDESHKATGGSGGVGPEGG